MSTIVELFDISQNGISKCDVPLTQPLFESFPNELIIDDYDAFGTYEYTIRFRNRDSVPRRLRVLHPEPMHFFIKQSPRSVAQTQKSRKTSSRVASGMTVEYILTFTPEERKEYECDLIIETERERFMLPIRAKGHPIKLEYPQRIDYGDIPVHYDNNKIILLRNVGHKSTRWQMYCDDGAKSILSFEPFEGLLDPNGFINVCVKLHAKTIGEYQQNVTLEHQEGTEQIEIFGNTQNIKLQISKELINPSPAYINLSSQSLFRFYNRSETPFTFSINCTNSINWNIEPQEGEIYPSGFIEFVVTFLPKESKIYKDKLYIDCLGREEPIAIPLEGTGIGPKAMFSFDTLDIGEIFLSAVHKYTVSLHNIGDIAGVFHIKMPRKNIQENQLEVDISPSSGTLEVGQVLEIIITLSGYKFGHFTLPLSCHFQGTDPLSLKLQGDIIAPKLSFDVEKLEFGTVSYGFENTQIVSLHNDSDIPVQFRACIPSDEIKREFMIKHYDIDDNNKDVNDEDVNINNGTFDGYNFKGCIYPRSSINLQIIFKSVSVKKYKDYSIMIDVDNVGDEYLSLPITANCVVPDIEIEEKEIDLKDTYLKYEYSGSITIRNDNDLPATFQFIPQNEKTKQIAIISFDEPMAVLSGKSKKSLKYHFYAQKLGESDLSCYVSVVGSTSAPLQVKFHFIGTGPKLKLSLKDNQDVDVLSEINFGNISALKKHSKILCIENICPISATLHAEVQKSNSCYNINVEDAVIKPNEILPITVDVYSNDTVKVTDDLIINVFEADQDITVSLYSRGVGTTLVPSIDMEFIDFLNQFTNNKCSKSLRIENRGKRAQTIVWNYVKRKEEIIDTQHVQNENENDENIAPIDDTQSEISLGSKSFASVGSNATSVAIGGSKYKSNVIDDEDEDDAIPSIFKITPAKITLQPNTAVDFKITAKSNEEGVITEMWECGVFVGKARKSITVFKPQVRCNFLKPLIEFSNKKLYFEYLYEENVLIKPLTKPFQLKNVSLLPLVFMIKCPVPFSVDRLEYILNPNQDTTVNVSFDPGMKTDRLCYRPKARLSIIYRDHPQRDKIPLYAECWFPNLQFPSTNISFGCVLNHTKAIKHITLQNISKVDVEFAWVFLQDEFEDMEPHLVPLEKRHFWVQNNRPKCKERERRNSLIQMTQQFNMTDLFDIRPLRGIIKAQESIQMSFVFNARPNIKVFGTALCEVTGGPDYNLQLTASTNSIAYDISTKCIDFGTNIMGQTVSDEIIVSNTSGVPFEFNINTDSLKYPQFIQINPVHGTVAGSSKQKISIKCTPLLPIEYKEEFQIQIAYFTPQTISVTMNAFCSEIVVDLPRDITPYIQQNEAYTTLLNVAEANVNKRIQFMYDTYQRQQQDALQAEQKDESPRDLTTDTDEPKNADIQPQDILREIELDNNYINREIDKLQYINVLSKLLSNHWNNNANDNQNKQKSKKITFSTKDLKIGYDESKLVTLSRDESNDTEIQNKIECNFNIYQYRSIGSIRYRSFELMIGFYLLSFGHVIHSLSYHKTFTLKNQDLFHYFKHQILPNNNDYNASAQPQQSLIVEYDKQFLGKTPFHIEPNKSIKITAKSSFEFVITYNPNKKMKQKSNKNGSPCIGPQKFSIPFRVGSGYGPCFCLNVQINMRIPDIQIQSVACDTIQYEEASLNFGDVLIGQCKDSYIRLINYELVNCEWKFDTLTDKKSSSNSNNNKKSWNQASQFMIEPKIGKLAPKQFVDVRIRYTPMKSGVTNIKFPLHVLHNEKVKSINIKGNGIRKSIHMQPKALSFDPVLPSTASEPMSFKIRNEGLSDVTVYSLDFDEQYINEEALLSSVKWPTGNKILVPPSVSTTDELKDVLKEQALLMKDEINQNNDEAKEKEKLKTTSIIALIHDPFYDIDAFKVWCEENEVMYITMDRMKESVLSMNKDQVKEEQQEVLEELQQNIEEDRCIYLPDIMILFLSSIKNPDYCIFDVSDCLSFNCVKDDEMDETTETMNVTSKSLSAEWLESFRILSNHELVSHFGIGYIASDDINDIQARFDAFQSKWNELLNDVPLDQFESEDEHLENDLLQYDLSREEYESLLPQLPHTEQENDNEDNEEEDENRAQQIEIVTRIQARETLRKQYISPTAFNNILCAMRIYSEYWCNPNVIQLHSAVLTRDELLAYLKNDRTDDARFRPPISLSQSHQILLKPRTSNDKCKITDYIQLYCKIKHEQTIEPEPVAVPKAKAKKSKKHQKPQQNANESQDTNNINPLLAGYHKIDHKARFTIEANSEMDFCIVFQSDICQQLEKYLRFAILGCKDIFKLSFNAVCALPEFDSTPKSLFSSLIPASKANTHKKYVESDNLYEFGALLAGIDPLMRSELPSIMQELEAELAALDKDKKEDSKDDKESDKIVEEEKEAANEARNTKKKQLAQLQKRWKTLHKMYSESIPVTNDGEFDLHLTFKWEHDGFAQFVSCDEADANRPDANDPSTVYFIEPNTLQIMKGETKTFKIWCFPSFDGTFCDVLQCQIANNPNPMNLKFRCRGCVPKIQLSTTNIDFDRQICGTDTLQQNIVLKNTSLVSAKWNISELDGMQHEFKISKMNGNIPANKKETICISFTPSDAEKQISHALHLNVLDTRSIKETVQQHFSNEVIEISAESFKMLPEIDIANSHLDFGVVKVNSKSIQKFTIQNNGKYALKFKLISSGKAAIRKLVKSSLIITPSSGSIDPKDKVEIVLVFQSKIEIEPLQKIQALKLHIIEDTKDCIYESIPIRISVSCVYAKFHTVPQSTINLGSVELLKTRTKSLELYNDGDFDLEYEIVTSLEQFELKNKLSLKQNEEEDEDTQPKDDDTAENENTLLIGRYIIDPWKGNVPKQGYKSISITLDAQELKSFKETIYLFIKHCSPFQPKLCFELTGESCSPGIDTHDFRNIFEEQSVVIQTPNNPYALTQNTFVVEDRAFLFTPIILNQSPSLEKKENANNDNDILVNSNAERFKITNPFNVPCDVQFNIEPRMGPEPCPFKLKQNNLHLSPHEYKYISCDFEPTNLDYYSAIFNAEVVDGQDEQTKQLTFELRGRGILPRLSILTNLENDELSRKVIELGRVFVNQSSNHSFTISNHGIIDAKYCYELQVNDADDNKDIKKNNVYQMFSVLTTDNESTSNKLIDVRTKEFILPPNGTQCVNVKFHPTEAGNYSLLIILNIDANPFESTTIVCKGVAYRQDITIFSPDLNVETIKTKKGTTDLHRSLNFNDLAVGSIRRKQVTLTNHSHYLYRFVANLPSDCISIRPNIGHILPDSSRILLLTLHAKQRAEIKETLAVALEQIKYENDKEEIMEWDNTMTQFRRLTLDEYKGEFGEEEPPQDAHCNNDFIELKESVAEPSYQVVNVGDPNELLMDILAVSDEGRYECTISEIKFEDTAMLQTSRYEFELANVSSVSLEYFWNITTFNNNDQVKSAFVIQPNMGTIAPKTKQIFCVSFAPKTPGQYQCELQSTITPLNEEQAASPLLLPMSGKSTRPICHFEFGEFQYSQYITSGIRKSSQTGPNGKIGESLQPNIRVLQSKSLGIQVRNKLSFVVLNTLDQSYNFMWKPKRVPNCFRCLTPSGEILPSKQYTMSFEYKPKKSEIVESFWEFTIDSHKYIVPFLIVGSVFEPDVRLSHSNIKFLPQLVGTSSQQVVHIENTENTAFEWWIDRNAFLKSIAKYRVSTNANSNEEKEEYNMVSKANPIPLIISTYSGVIEANSSFNIELTFKPLRELQYNFNIAFHVRNKPAITMLNVKGEGFMIHPEIEFIDDKTILNLQPKRLTPINFGNIHIKQSKHKKFIIYNKSNKYPFEFNWKFLWPRVVSTGSKPVTARTSRARTDTQTNEEKVNNDRSSLPTNRSISNTSTSGIKSRANKKKYQNELLRQCLTITPGQGTIAPQHEIECELTFKSLSQITIDQQKLLTLEIGKNKHKNYLYPFAISAKARKPRIEFIPASSVNFGDCFLYHANSKPLTQQFTIKNKEIIGSITVDVMFENQPHLEVSPTGSVVVESQKQVEIEVTFRPRQTKLYSEKILLDINGLFTSEVIVKGKGIDLKVDVEDESQRSMSFGNLRVGQTRTKKLSLINKSKKITTCSISLDHILSTKYIAVDPVPLEKFRLRKNEKKYISLTFHPPIRLAPFEGNLLVNAEGQSCILSRIRGGCHGIGAKLDSDTLSFGTVVAGSSKKMSIKLCNTGDVGVKFRWDTKPIKPHFSLQPVMGYIEENGYILIQVLFRPKAVKQNIRINRVACYIEGDASIQYLSLIGSCMNQPTGETYQITMDTKVRTISTAELSIQNNTNEDWELHPVIQNDYYFGPNKVHVKKHSEYKYVIQYRPLLMTTPSNQYHRGSIFFPLPNGTAILYNLIGTASSPDIENEIDIKTPAKQNKTITLSVKNWLNKRQRFHVEISDTKESVFINGVEWIDIPGLHNRNYRLVFYSLKQGDITFYIKFVNEKINEFIQYKVNVTITEVTIDLHPLASASGYSDQVISMQSTVRNRLAYQLSINNPLLTNRAIISKFQCDSNHIYIPDLPFELPSDSQKRLTIYYRPLCQETKKESILTLYSDELGEYKYLLKLTSTPVGIDKILKFNSFLGGEDLQTFRFLHYYKLKNAKAQDTTYDVRITSESRVEEALNDFCVQQKQLKVSERINDSNDDNNNNDESISVSIDITYTPSNIGNVRNLLIISSSANNSTYQCALHGFCDPPKPKGPYEISTNKANLQIPFQNPYRENCQFEFNTDNNCFVLKKQSEIIKPKAKTMIDVQFKLENLQNKQKKHIMGKLIIKSKNKHEWVYYIRGVIA